MMKTLYRELYQNLVSKGYFAESSTSSYYTQLVSNLEPFKSKYDDDKKGVINKAWNNIFGTSPTIVETNEWLNLLCYLVVSETNNVNFQDFEEAYKEAKSKYFNYFKLSLEGKPQHGHKILGREYFMFYMFSEELYEGTLKIEMNKHVKLTMNNKDYTTQIEFDRSTDWAICTFLSDLPENHKVIQLFFRIDKTGTPNILIGGFTILGYDGDNGYKRRKITLTTDNTQEMKQLSKEYFEAKSETEVNSAKAKLYKFNGKQL